MTLYIGVDFHPYQQTVSWCDRETGEIMTRTIRHKGNELADFYKQMPPAVVGIEATSKATWFEKLLFENQHQMLVGNARIIRKKSPTRHKNDRRDSRHILDLLMTGKFPELWRRPEKSSEILELLRLRHSLVRQRTQAGNRLQALAREAGLKRRKAESKLFQDQLLKVEGYGERFVFRARLLIGLWNECTARIRTIERCLEEDASSDERVALLRTQPGVAMLTALCLVHTVGDISRFDRPTKQIVSFVGLDPLDNRSADRVKRGPVSKEGSKLLRFLLGQAGHSAARFDPAFKAKSRQLSKKKTTAVVKTAIARKLLVKLVIMLRDSITAQEFDRRGRTVGNARGAQGVKAPSLDGAVPTVP